MNDMTYVCLSRNKNNPSSDGTDRPLNHYVSFIGFILLTKSLSCNDAILTGILNYFRSLKKAISEFQEDSTKFLTQQKLDPLFPSR